MPEEETATKHPTRPLWPDSRLLKLHTATRPPFTLAEELRMADKEAPTQRGLQSPTLPGRNLSDAPDNAEKYPHS